MLRRFPRVVFLGVLFLSSVLPLFGSGFMIREQSAAGLGNAFAGSNTGAHDLSDMFFNPASMFSQDNREAQLSFSSLAINSTYQAQTATNILGTAIPGNLAGSDIAPTANIPAFYATVAHGPKQKFGLAVNAPWGLESNNPAGWVGRYHALSSKMKTLNLTPMWGWKMGDRTAGAIGWQRQKIEATMDNAIDFGTIGAISKIPGATPGKQDGYASVEGDAWGNGFVLGLLHEFDARNKAGLSYRSQVKNTLHGTGIFAFDTAGVGKTLAAATKAFSNTGVSAEMNTPSVLGFGYQHRFNDRWLALLDVSKTGWSNFQELRVKFDNPAQADSVTNEKWHDSWFYALGFQYKPQSKLTWKIGTAFDQAPVDDEYRVPRIPISSSRWLTLGASWKASDDTVLDLSVARLSYGDAPIRLSAKDTGNTFRGNLIGSYQTSVTIIGFSVQTKFR